MPGSKYQRIDITWKQALLTLAVFIIIGTVAYRLFAPHPTYDLASYYPNTTVNGSKAQYQTNYLDGVNNFGGNPSPTVLWFEKITADSKIGEETFRMYNSSPRDASRRCHYDVLTWKAEELVYSQTHDACTHGQTTDIIYTPAITYLPRNWTVGTNWSASNESNAVYSVNGIVRCTGTNEYTAKVLGFGRFDRFSSKKGLHWTTSQKIHWKTGKDVSGCSANTTLHYQDDYWLSDHLPTATPGVYAKGLRYTKGGNQVLTVDNWDITFNSWQPLPNVDE